MYAGQFGSPGVGSTQSSSARQILWGRPQEREVIDTGAVISSTATDAGNTPTTVLRAGTLMGVITASGKWAQWNPDASDGTETLRGVLPVELAMVDHFGTAVDRDAPMILKAPVRTSMLLTEGDALDGDVDEYLARRKLAEIGFTLDDDVQNFKSGINQRTATKITDYTVVGDDNGTLFLATTADATFTLPAIAAGLSFEFLRIDDFEMVVASAEGDNMIVGNDASADSVTFTTASQQIGARVKITGIYVGTTLKWLAELPHTPFGTGTATLAYTIAT